MTEQLPQHSQCISRNVTFSVSFAEATENTLGSQSPISCADHRSLQCALSELKLVFFFGLSVYMCFVLIQALCRSW